MEKDIKKIKGSVELHTRLSSKGNVYQVLVVKTTLLDDREYDFETFLDKEQLLLLSMTK